MTKHRELRDVVDISSHQKRAERARWNLQVLTLNAATCRSCIMPADSSKNLVVHLPPCI